MMTDTLTTDDGGTEDDGDTFTVDTTDYVAPAPRQPRGKGGTCKTCGISLTDGRASYCEEHKPARGVGATKRDKPGRSRRAGKGKVSAQVEDGLSGIAGQILFLLTLGYAYSALKRNGIPDPSGDISETMALTDDESVAIARPLSRLFLSTEQGRKVAPTIVDNRDLIDAGFALWDWFRRTNEVLETYGRTASVQTPVTGGQTNGYSASTQGDRGDSGGGSEPYYVGPSQQDLLAGV